MLFDILLCVYAFILFITTVFVFTMLYHIQKSMPLKEYRTQNVVGLLVRYIIVTCLFGGVVVFASYLFCTYGVVPTDYVISLLLLAVYAYFNYALYRNSYTRINKTVKLQKGL